MTPRLGLAVLGAALILTACGDDSSSDSADEPATAESPTESEEPLPMPTKPVCGDLDLSGVGDAAGGKVKIKSDLGKGDKPPYPGPKLQSPQCELDASGTTAQLAINPGKQQATDGLRKWVKQLDKARTESLGGKCSNPQPQEVGEYAGVVNSCQQGEQFWVSHNVVPGEFMASCGASGDPADEQRLRETAIALCEAYVGSLED